MSSKEHERSFFVSNTGASKVNRRLFVASIGAATLAGCSAANMRSFMPIAITSRKASDYVLPAGYTTSSSGTSSFLFYNGQLVATITTDPNTWTHTFTYNWNGQRWTTPTFATVNVGSSYSPIDGTTCTFGLNTYTNTTTYSTPGSSGSHVFATNTSGDYNSTFNDSTAFPQGIYQDYGVLGNGTGSGCKTTVCPNSSVNRPGHPLHTESQFRCLVAAAVALGTTTAFVVTIALAVAGGPLTLLAATGLILEHGLTVTAIASAVVECL